jgi:hypothetical protein
MVGRAELQYHDGDAFLFLEERTQDRDLLFKKTATASCATIYHRTGTKTRYDMFDVFRIKI